MADPPYVALAAVLGRFFHLAPNFGRLVAEAGAEKELAELDHRGPGQLARRLAPGDAGERLVEEEAVDPVAAQVTKQAEARPRPNRRAASSSA